MRFDCILLIGFLLLSFRANSQYEAPGDSKCEMKMNVLIGVLSFALVKKLDEGQ